MVTGWKGTAGLWLRLAESEVPPIPVFEVPLVPEFCPRVVPLPRPPGPPVPVVPLVPVVPDVPDVPVVPVVPVAPEALKREAPPCVDYGGGSVELEPKRVLISVVAMSVARPFCTR